MRIISGEFGGRRILPPEGQVTRPITDRVKQSLFDILTPLLGEARVYDCFSGTGSLGLEALSRGAGQVSFFEADRSAILLLKRNIATLGVEGRTQVIGGDLFKWFKANTPAEERVDVIFLDPPYPLVRQRPEDVRRLVEQMASGHLRPEGTIVFRRDAAEGIRFGGVEVYDQRDYGSMTVELLRAGGGQTGSGGGEGEGFDQPRG